MKTRWLIFFLVGTLTVLAQSDRTQEMEMQKKELLTEIDNTNKLLNENKKTTKTILNRLDMITQQIDSRKQLIGLLEKEITLLDGEIQAKEQQIQKLEKKVQQKKKDYIVAVQKIYTQKNNQNQLLFILSADNMMQSFHRTVYLKRYIDWSKKQAEEIVMQQNAIADEKAALNTRKKEKELLAVSRKAEEVQLQKEENNKKGEVAGLQKDAKKLEKEINAKKKQMAALSKEIDRIIAEDIAAARRAAKAQANAASNITANAAGTAQPLDSAASSASSASSVSSVPSVPAESADVNVMTREELSLSASFAQNRGKLPFPVRGSYKIVSRFGQQRYLGLKNRVVSNSNGIEIETTRGNSAKAVFDGEVTAIVLVPGFQTSVIIKHGNYYTLYSYLEQVYVKKGYKVKMGQDIGKIFSDDSTILYFELRKDTTKLNPELWLGK